MVEDIDPHIIGMTEYWATTDISDTELGMTEYVMFRKDRNEEGEVKLFYILTNPSRKIFVHYQLPEFEERERERES